LLEKRSKGEKPEEAKNERLAEVEKMLGKALEDEKPEEAKMKLRKRPKDELKEAKKKLGEGENELLVEVGSDSFG